MADENSTSLVRIIAIVGFSLFGVYVLLDVILSINGFHLPDDLTIALCICFVGNGVFLLARERLLRGSDRDDGDH
jgi:hypothetical protein